MSILNSIKQMFGSASPPHDEHEPIGFDDDGRQLYKDDVIAFVNEQLTKRKNERSGLELQWTLNANFLAGNQLCDINTYTHTVEQYPFDEDDDMERNVFNQIAPLIDTRIANLKKINYSMRVKPRTNEDDDYSKAEISTALLQFKQSDSDFQTKKNTMIAWNELCGSCFWLAWWDTSLGNKYAEAEVTEISEDGTQRQKTTAYYTGDVDYGLLTPYEVYPESIFKQGIENQRSIIIEQVKTVGEIYDLYDIKVDGTAVESFALTPVSTVGGYGCETTTHMLGHRTIDDAQKVITYFERPSRHRPNGRMIIIVGDEHLVYYGDLPYSRIPIVQCVCREAPGQFFGKSVIEDLIPRQRAYNGCVNRIHEYIKNVVIQSYITERGSVDIDEFEERLTQSGAILEYARGSTPPIPVSNSVLPSDVFEERQSLKSEMEYVAGVSQLMVTGNAPQTNMSGTAIENLMQIDSTRLSLTGDHIRNSVKNLAKLWLEIYKRYAKTKRVADITGLNSIGNALVWCDEDINSFDIEYTTENELIMSEDMQKQRMIEAFNMGLFTDENGRIPERIKLKILEAERINSYDEVMSINQLQIQAAQRENKFFECGAIPEVSEFDEHHIHVEEHMRYMLQMDFNILKRKKPQYAAEFENHIRQHKQEIARKEQQQAMQLQKA